ncbi:hypothetical protein F4778DRAFT_780790 [Xylariomycetidae sp. FL2044]|nr:hypothetical protein F4778DRAFT_780790 [Xylariomycetidae sp. FL2044]
MSTICHTHLAAYNNKSTDQRREISNADREEEAVKNDSIISYETIKYSFLFGFLHPLVRNSLVDACPDHMCQRGGTYLLRLWNIANIPTFQTIHSSAPADTDSIGVSDLGAGSLIRSSDLVPWLHDVVKQLQALSLANDEERPAVGNPMFNWKDKGKYTFEASTHDDRKKRKEEQSYPATYNNFTDPLPAVAVASLYLTTRHWPVQAETAPPRCSSDYQRLPKAVVSPMEADG